MLKKILSISFVIIAFGLLLSHELIPHHHHGDSEVIAHEHNHDGGEHSHHILELFFSLLHHSDFSNLVLISPTVNNKVVESNFCEIDMQFLFYNKAHLALQIKNKSQKFLFAFDKLFYPSLSFRGPPIA